MDDFFVHYFFLERSCTQFFFFDKNLNTVSISIYLWGQFLPRPSVALVVIFGLESPTLEEKPSFCYLIRHEPMVEEYH